MFVFWELFRAATTFLMSRHRDIRNLNIQGAPPNVQSVNMKIIFDYQMNSRMIHSLTAENTKLRLSRMVYTLSTSWCSPEEFLLAQLNDGLGQVRSIIGGEDVCGISDDSIREVLWEYYFNVEKTVRWAVG